jgi:small basic protein
MPIFLSPARTLAANTLTSFSVFEWLRLGVGSVACGLLAVRLGHLLGFPGEPGFTGSVFASGSPVLGSTVALIALVIGLLVGSFFTASIRPEAGLFCSLLGLAGLALRCGPIRPVMQYAGSSSVFVLMSLETVLLGVLILAVWLVFGKLFSGSFLLQFPAPAAPNELVNPSIDKKLAALGVQAAVMGVLEMIFIQSDAQAQGLLGVGIAGYLAALVSYMVTPLSEGIWNWAGPILLGAAAYLIAYFSGGGVATGEAHGWFAPLVRVTPLGYTAMGISGALLGYWCSRQWAQPEESEAQETTAVTGA